MVALLIPLPMSKQFDLPSASAIHVQGVLVLFFEVANYIKPMVYLVSALPACKRFMHFANAEIEFDLADHVRFGHGSEHRLPVKNIAVLNDCFAFQYLESSDILVAVFLQVNIAGIGDKWAAFRIMPCAVDSKPLVCRFMDKPNIALAGAKESPSSLSITICMIIIFPI